MAASTTKRVKITQEKDDLSRPGIWDSRVLKSALRLAEVGSCYLDFKSGLWTSSTYLDEIFGIDEKYQRDLAGWLQIAHPDHREEMARYIEEDVRNKKLPFDKEYKIIRQNDNEERWVYGRGELEFDSSNKPVRLTGYVKDITEIKRTEEALKKSTQTLNEAQKIAKVGSWEWNVRTNQVSWSEQMELMHGFEPGDFDGTFETALKHMHPDDVTAVTDDIQDMLASKKPRDFQYRIITVSGDVKWVAGDQRMTFDEAGEVVVLNGVLRDITEQVKREEELKTAELRSRTLLEGSPVCNKIISHDNKLQYMSSAGIMELKIKNVEALYGEIYPSVLYPEKYRKPLVECLAKAQKGEISSVECPIPDSDGKEVWYHTTFVPARDQNDQILYIIASSVNITERMDATREMHSANDRLAMSLVELEKSNAAMISIQEIERSRIAKDLHDGLGQTLASLNMFVKAMQEEMTFSPGDRAADLFNTITELSDRALSETRTISHNLMPSSLEKFGLTVAISELASNMNKLYGSLKMQFKTDIGEHRFAHEVEITVYRLIQEILHNTVKHARASTFNLSLQIEKGRIIIHTKDDGVGFNVEKARETSVGLGISGLYNRVAGLKGEINITSQQERGTSTYISLPTTTPETKKTSQKAESAA